MKPKPKPTTHQQPMIGTMHLELAIDMDYELVCLAQTINWDAIAAEFRSMYCPSNGRPVVPTRLMAGLQFLKHTFNLSDEQVVTRWTDYRQIYGLSLAAGAHQASQRLFVALKARRQLVLDLVP